jgi:hypothetical protein
MSRWRPPQSKSALYITPEGFQLVSAVEQANCVGPGKAVFYKQPHSKGLY